MAVFEEMTETKGQSSPRRSKSILQKFSDEFASPSSAIQPNARDDGEVADVDIFSRLTSSLKFNRQGKNQYVTPIATPATVMETPVSEDSSAGSDFHPSRTPSPIYKATPLTAFSKFNLSYELGANSLTLPTDLTKKSSSHNSENLLKCCTANLSTQHQARTLFHELSNDVTPSENSVVASHRNVPRTVTRLSRSAGPGIPESSSPTNDNDQFLSSRTELESNSTRSQRLRSRRYHLIDEETTPSKSMRSERRRQSRRRSSTFRNYCSDTNSSTFSLSVISIDDEVSVSSNDDNNMELSNNSSRRRSENNMSRSKQRTKQFSHSLRPELSGNGNDQNGECGFLKKARVKRLATTKTLVWLLCLVGIASVSMIVLTNHRIGTSFHANEQNYEDHVTVLFRKRGNKSVAGNQIQSNVRRKDLGLVPSESKQDRISSAKRKVIPRRDDESLSSFASPIRLGNLNFNKLSHFQEPQMNDYDTSNDSKERNGDHVKSKDKGKDTKKSDDHTQSKHTSHGKHSAAIQMSKEIHSHDKSKTDTHTHKHREDHHSHHHLHTTHEKVSLPQIESVEDMTVANDGRIATPVGWIRTVHSASDRYLYEGILPSLSGGLTSNRIVMLGNFDGNRNLDRELELYPSPYTDNTQVYPILDSRDDEDERIRTMEMRRPYSEGECVPMADWQTTFNPSCNGMHELDIAAIEQRDIEEDFTLFGKNGFWRNAWKFEKILNESPETVVLKTLKINHRFEDAHYEHNRIDAVVLERLTASPHVIDIFGFCGHSVMTEYADGKRLGDLADKNKKIPLARLKIAVDIASGLADVHGIDGEKHASFVHLDINPANVVSIGGTLKLNDFNIGILRRWNTTSDSPCGIPAQYPNPQWRSPEEAKGANDLTEKVDVFSMGHIFFRLICGHEPWNKFEVGGMPEKAELNEKVKNGILPRIPDEITKSKDPEVVAIREAMLQCYRYDPLQRPSARSIVNKLMATLVVLQSKKS